MCKLSRKLKGVFILLSIFVIMLSFCFNSYAYEETTTEAGTDYTIELSDSTSEILSEIGIDTVDYDEIINTSPRKVIKCLIDIAKGKLKEPLKIMGTILAVSTLVAVASCFVNKDSSKEYAVNTVCSFVMISSLLVPVSNVISTAASSITLTTDFMKAYIPVFAGVVSAGGMPVTSAVYSAAELGVAEVISQLSSGVFISLSGLILMVSVLSSFSENIDSGKIISIIKKSISIVLGLLATVFVGMITIKGELASSADSVTVRGIKLVAGNTIPIVGGAVGEAYSSVLGSLNLIKSTVGAFGIIAIAAVNIPVIIELLLWYFAVNLCSVFCGVLNDKSGQRLLDGISGVIVLVNTITIFSAVLFILSTGIILSMRT